MSDTPLGPGWWQASDGRWYPPESAPGPQGPPQQGPPPGQMPPQQGPPPQMQGQGYPPYQQQPYPGAPPEPKPKSKGPLIGILVAVAAVAAAVIGFIVVSSGGDDDTSTDTTTVDVDDGDDDEDESTSTTSEEGGGDDLAVEVPDGFEPFVSEDEEVAIALPAEWEEFDLSDPNVQASLDDFTANNPEMGSALDQAEAMIAAGGVLFALDPAQFPFAPNINILRSPGEVDLEFAQTTVDSQLEGIGAENITSEIVELPVGEALAIEYDLPLNLADGSTTQVHGVQYQIPSAGSTWAITMTTDDMAANGDQFDQMIETFTVAE